MEIERANLMYSWPELLPLLQQHWDEFQGHRDVQLDPDVDGYALLERANRILFVTVRPYPDGPLVGYWLGMLVPNMHSKDQLVCMADGMYLMPKYRNGTGKEMADMVENYARHAGADRMVQGTCVRHPIDNWLIKRGYEIEDHVYLKELK